MGIKQIDVSTDWMILISKRGRQYSVTAEHACIAAMKQAFHLSDDDLVLSREGQVVVRNIGYNCMRSLQLFYQYFCIGWVVSSIRLGEEPLDPTLPEPLPSTKTIKIFDGRVHRNSSTFRALAEHIKSAIYEAYQTVAADVAEAVGHEPSAIECMEAACGLDSWLARHKNEPMADQIHTVYKNLSTTAKASLWNRAVAGQKQNRSKKS
jgi:hypothetical protein